MKKNLLLLMALLLAASCNHEQQNVRLITLDPGHFHAALVQKTSYPEVSPVVYVYAPEDGDDLKEHLKRIDDYNARPENPTHWQEIVYTGPDFLEKMVEEKKGNVMVVAGNNRKKTEYIEKALSASINVLSDKPMAINPENFDLLEKCFTIAAQNKVLLYDIMTERFEITTILQKELYGIPAIYGEQTAGTPDDPAIETESVHLFLKTVSGKPLTRPVWFFDTEQQGEAIADVAVHLVDLVQWELFPEQAIDYHNDIEVIAANHWATKFTAAQFEEVTGSATYPEFLLKDVVNDTLNVYANGDITYKIKGIHAKVTARWDYTNTAGDTHYSIMKGSRANLIILQGAEQGYKPTLYIEPAQDVQASDFEQVLQESFAAIAEKYTGVQLRKTDNKWEVVIPDTYRNGHEAHFGQVTENFLKYLKQGALPEWEIPCMLAKYYVTTKGLEIAKRQ